MTTTADPTGKFVIRRHTPVRTRLLQAAALLIGLFALYVVFELGRYRAGFDRAGVSRERAEHERTISALQAQIHDLHVQLAQLQTLQAGAAREQQEVGQELAGLQAQLDRDRQDLAVYRGVIAPAANGTSLQVQQLRITAGDGPNHFIVHLTLMQGGKPDAKVSGKVNVRVTGDLNGSAGLVGGLAPAPDGAVSFRYYQAVDYQIALPPGFKPQHVQVTLQDSRADGATATQDFPWRLDVQP
jgi:FtsP/CotA-like multicopper oxidase with cupredoxin domain